MIGLGLLKAMKVTLRNALKVPFTIQYPDRKVGIIGAAKNEGKSTVGLMATQPVTAAKAALSMYSVPVNIPQNRRFRGNEFTWYEDRCTGCASCAKYCPLGIIEIVTSPGGFDVQQGESYAIDVFDIDIGRCMFCGLCVEACPYDALHMGSQFERSKYERDALVISVDELRQALRQPSSWFRPQFEERDYDPFRDGPEDDHYKTGRHEMPDQETLDQRWVEDR